MTRPAWLDAVPREYRRHDRTMVGVIGEDGIDIRRADHADTYELRVGSDETVRSGYFGLGDRTFDFSWRGWGALLSRAWCGADEHYTVFAWGSSPGMEAPPDVVRVP